jgi:pimeloyl-ACP methyl ester carboxylesterase
VDIHWDEAGHGPALILLHGLTYDGRVWAPQAIPLARRFRVIVPDLRGHGRSSAPPTGYGFRDHAEDMLAFADRLELSAFHVAGLSLGAGVGVELALAAPDRVRSLALLSPSVGGWRYGPSWRLLWRQVLRAVHDRGLAAAMKHEWLGCELHRVARDRLEARALLEVMTGCFSGRPLEMLSMPPQDGDAHEAVDRLGEIRAPTAIAVGEADHADVLAIADRMASSVPDATLFRFPGVGHVLPLEEPERVGELIASNALAAEQGPVGAVA